MDVPVEFAVLLTKINQLKIIDSIEANMEATEKILRNYLFKIFQAMKSECENGITKLAFFEVFYK